MILPELLVWLLLTTGTSHAFVVPKNSCTQPILQPFTRNHQLFRSKTCTGGTTTTTTTTQLHLFDFFQQPNKLTEFFQENVIPQQKPVYEAVTIQPDFRVAILFLTVGAVLDTIPYIQWTLGLFITLLGVLFVVQTFRIRFVFDEDNCLELKTVASWFSGTNNDANENLQDSGENVVVGGANRWACDTIVNYDFFPKGWIDDEENPIGPILVYFKETQTSAETWEDGPGQWANNPDRIATGQAKPGQVHFFPAVCNAKQIREEFAKRGCGKI